MSGNNYGLTSRYTCWRPLRVRSRLGETLRQLIHVRENARRVCETKWRRRQLVFDHRIRHEYASPRKSHHNILRRSYSTLAGMLFGLAEFENRKLYYDNRPAHSSILIREFLTKFVEPLTHQTWFRVWLRVIFAGRNSIEILPFRNKGEMPRP